MNKVVSPRNTILVGVMAILLILAGGYLLVLAPISKQRAERLEALQIAQDSVDAAQNQLITSQRYERNFPVVLSENERLSVHFPTTASIESLNRSVLEAASSAGIPSDDVTSISTSVPSKLKGEAKKAPAKNPDDAASDADDNEDGDGDTAPPPPAESTLATMNVTISVSGTRQSLTQFLKNLEEMDRVLLVTASSLSGEAGNMRLSVNAVSYLYGPIQNPAEPVPTEDDDVVTETEPDATNPDSSTGAGS